MQFNTLLSPGRTQCGVEGGSKKRVLDILAHLIADELPTSGLTDTNGEDATQTGAGDILRALIAREKLGSTGLGLGIAIPHCRLANCDQTLGALAVLREPVDFDSPDDQPVDIVCALVVPEQACDDHLQTLAKLVELFHRPEVREQLRAQTNSDQLFAYAQAQLSHLQE